METKENVIEIVDKNKNFSNEVKPEEKEPEVDIEAKSLELQKEINSEENKINEAEESQEESEDNASKNGENEIDKPNLEQEDSLSDSKKTAWEKYHNIDWSKISPKKVMQINAEVMLENKRLMQEKIQYQNELAEYAKKNVAITKVREELDKTLDYIASKLFCCSSLMMKINNGEKLSPVEKADEIVKNVTQNETKILEENAQYIKKLKDNKVVLDNLREQLYQLTIDANKKSAKENDQAFSPEDIRKMINLTPKSPDIIIKAIPLDTAKETFNEKVASAVVEAIGKKGISEFPEICDYCVTKGINDTKVEDAIYTLEKEKIVITELIKPFNRNRGVRLVKLTDDLGKKLYLEKYKEEPVEPEMDKIRRENDNYEHGYSIKDCYLQLLSFGYKEEDLSMERKKNTITVSGSVTWVPDIVAKNPVSPSQTEYYEVETGKCNQKALEYKLDKAVLVTKKLKIIVGNKMVADEYLEYVKNWYNSKKIAPAITVVIASFQEFKTKDKTRFRSYPKIQKEDINITNEVLKDIQKEKNKK